MSLSRFPFHGIPLTFLIGSDPPAESDCHQAASSDLKGLKNHHRDLDLRFGQRGKSGEHDMRERYAHSGSLGGDAVGHGDRVFFSEPEYGQGNANADPEDVVGD